MDFFSFMAVLIEHPALALGPAALLFCLFLVSRNLFILIVAILWLAYVPYEYGMKYRVLCSGDCDIRIDLLLIYPAMAVAFLVGMVLFLAAVGRRR
jgi:hypothetical protein